MAADDDETQYQEDTAVDSTTESDAEPDTSDPESPTTDQSDTGEVSPFDVQDALANPPQDNSQPGPVVSATPEVVDAVTNAESATKNYPDGNPNATGPDTGKGRGTAKGLMQLLDSTGREWHDKLGIEEPYNPYDKEQNKKIGTAYLDSLIKKYGDLKLGLAAYNHGMGNVDEALSKVSDKTYDAIAAHLPEETQKYVPKIIARLGAKGTDSPSALNIPKIASSVDSTRKGFADGLLQIVSQPQFDDLPLQDKLQSMRDFARSKKGWDNGVADILKTVASGYIDAAPDDQKPNYEEIVGGPPLVGKDENPKEVLGQWADGKVQELRRQGVVTSLLGTQFDDYLAKASSDETDAHTARNRSTVGLIANRAVNVGQDLIKGAAQLPADAVAGATRLSGFSETADAIQEAPGKAIDYALGKPTKDYLYVTDEKGRPVPNENGDGFKTHWQSQAAQSIGMVGGAIATLGVGAYVGIGAKALAIANMSENTLAMANGTFKHVYDTTGSLSSAYKASLFALPAAAVASLGEVGVVGGLFRSELKALTLYDQARFLGLAMTKNVIVGGVTGGASDAVLQAGEISQVPGQKFSGERLAFATATSAAGAGIAGTVVDGIRANKDFNVRAAERQAQVSIATKQLVDFRNGIASKVITNTDAADISPEIAQTLGINVEKTDGGVVLTKKANIVENLNVGPEDLPGLVAQLQSLNTPTQLKSLAEEQQALSQKQVRTPEEDVRLTQIANTLSDSSKSAHMNDVKIVEGQIYSALSKDPGAMPVRYDTGTQRWEHVETGRSGEFLSDVLRPEPVEKTFEHDATDNNLNIIDEEKIAQTAVTPEVLQAKESEVLAHDTNTTTLDTQYSAELLKLSDMESQDKVAVKNSKIAENLTKSLEGLKAEIAKLPDAANLKAPEAAATARADALKVDLEKAKADLAEFRATNWAKLTPAEKKVVVEKGQAKGRAIKKIEAEILKNRASVRTEEKAAGEFESQKKLAAQREALTKRLNEKQARYDAIDKTTLSPDLEAQKSTVAELRSKLDAAKLQKKTLSTELAQTRRAAKEYTKLKDKIDGVADKGLGALISSEGKKELVLPKGLAPAAKEQVLAHELGHTATEKVTLTPEAQMAVRGRLAELNAKALVAEAKDLAAEVLLPEVLPQVKIPEGTVKALTAQSRKALTSERELMANQIGAIILKRAGKSIGKYEIIPEVEAALETTKLPALPGPDNTISPVKEQGTEAIAPSSETKAPETETKAPVTETKVASSEIPPAVPEAPPPITPPEGGSPLNLETGELKETAFSKSVREGVPGMSPEMYKTVSRVRGQADAKLFVNQHGAQRTLDLLSGENALRIDPLSRVPLTEALLEKTTADLEAHPTPENRERSYQAIQMRAHLLTSAAQQLSLGMRFRNTNNFAEFLAVVDKSYREAGQEPPSYTEYQLKELKLAYNQTQGLPDGVLRDTYTQRLFEKTLQMKGTTWPEFLSGYIRTNLLSGVGTQAINATAGFYSGPVVTGLAHPILGRGLIWRAMWNIKDVGYANAKRVMEGKGGYNLFGGMVDPKPIPQADYSSIPKAMGTIYNKFGRTVWNALAAVDTFNRTLSAEGYIAKEQYASLKKRYGDNPDKFSAEVSKIILNKTDKQAAVTQAEREGRALGLDLTDADKYARAYEILRKNDVDAVLLQNATDWSYVTSLLGNPSNPLQSLARGLFNSHVWNTHPILNGVKNIIEPFGRAMIALSDVAQDFIPGNYFADKGYRAVSNFLEKGVLEPRNKASTDRLIAGQKIGTVIAAIGLGLARSGIAKITGEAEKQLGEGAGKGATTRSDFKEFEQKGDPEYSIVFKNGYTFNYKDFPGLNAVLYGIHIMDKKLDAGEGLLPATLGFYRGAYGYAIPFLGGGTLNSPIWKLINDMVAEDTTPKALQAAFENFAVTAAKMVTPASSLLADIKKLYDTTPEESNQDLLTKIFKDIPIASEAFGSKPALDRFGHPKTRSTVEHIPGVGRLVGSVREPGNRVWEKLRDRGIIVPELKTTIKFTKSDFLNEKAQTKYEATRSERLSKAYTNSFTPDEWYAFIKATGPHVERVAEQLADSGLKTDKAQAQLIKRVRAIEDQSKKRYVRVGHF